MIKKAKKVLKERWKFYLIGYMIGYLIPIINDRKVNLHYLFPFKLIGAACALGIGTAFYYGSKKIPVFEMFTRSVKYVIFILILFLITFFIKVIILKITGFDIIPLIGL